jgi:hypothetical protein
VILKLKRKFEKLQRKKKRNYSGRAPDEWLEALGTNELKPFLEEGGSF